MKSKIFFYQNDQREELYKLWYIKTFSEIFVFFVVEYPWNYPSIITETKCIVMLRFYNPVMVIYFLDHNLIRGTLFISYFLLYISEGFLKQNLIVLNSTKYIFFLGFFC